MLSPCLHRKIFETVLVENLVLVATGTTSGNRMTIVSGFEFKATITCYCDGLSII